MILSIQKTYWALLVSVITFGGFVPACAESSFSNIRVQYNIAYGPQAEEKLDLCVPNSTTNLHPGVILIHGGGWAGGDKKAFQGECLDLSKRGFVVANIDYRLGNKKDPNGAPWPAQLVDAQLAVRWMRAHAVENLFDPNRLCSYGGSAGGHLAVFLGVMPTIAPGAPGDLAPSLYSTQNPGVSCVVDEFGPVDFMSADYLVKKLNPGLFGGATLASNPVIFHKASPVFYVTPHSAPMLVVQGFQDRVVHIDQSRELIDALQKNSIPVEHIFYQGDHSFVVSIKDPKPWKRIPNYNEIRQQVTDYLVKMLRP